MLSVFLLAAVAALAIDPMAGKIVTINERPMISLRDFAEIFDADVDYNVEEDEISIWLYDTVVYLVPYRMNAWVNDRKVWLDMPVVIMDDVTYLPVRFLCEAFRLNYEWGQDNRQVIIINRWTTERVVVVIDLDWCRLPHNWRYNFDFNWYINFHRPCRDWRPRDGYRPPPHGNPPPGIDQYHNDKPPHYDGGNPNHDNDSPHGGPPQHDGGNQNHNIGPPQSGPPQHPGGGGNPNHNIGPPQSGPPQHQSGGGNPNHNIDPPQSGPPQQQNGGGPWNGGHNPQLTPGQGRPDGDFQRDYGKPVDGRPDGKFDTPLWKRDARPDDRIRPAGFPLNIDWQRKEVVITPGSGTQHGGPGQQASGPPPGYQNKEQHAGTGGNGRQEKESKDQSSEKDNGEKERGGDNGHGKGRDK